MKKEQRKKDTLSPDGFRIPDSISQIVRETFIKNAAARLKRMEEILKPGQFEQGRQEVYIIAHMYKGNASMLGLTALAAAAKKLEHAFDNKAPEHELIDLARVAADVLRTVVTVNSPGI